MIKYLRNKASLLHYTELGMCVSANLGTYSAKCGNRRPDTGASLFVQVQSLPDFSLSHLLEGINTRVLKRFVSKHNIQQVTGLDTGGAERQTDTHHDGWGKGEDREQTMHCHARGTYALVFRWLGAKEDARKKDKLVLQPRTEWRGNQRDFNEAGQSSKVTSVKKSFNRPFHQTLAVCACACICMEREKERDA